MMADGGVARPAGSRPDRGGPGDDPVREIRHTTNNFELDQSQHVTVGELNQTILAIDDRDTMIVDSFNNDNATDNDTNVVAIQDNDTIDNSTTNDVDVLNVEDSFNDGPTGAGRRVGAGAGTRAGRRAGARGERRARRGEGRRTCRSVLTSSRSRPDLPDDLEPAVG